MSFPGSGPGGEEACQIDCVTMKECRIEPLFGAVRLERVVAMVFRNEARYH